MSIFSKSSRSTLEAAQDELAKLHRRQEFSQSRLADATAAHAAAVAARTEILGGDDDDHQGLARADVCLAEARRLLDAAADAAAVLAQKISEVEQKIAVEQEAIARAEAAAMFERFRTDIAAALGDYRSAGERLIAALAASTTEGVGLASACSGISKDTWNATPWSPTSSAAPPAFALAPCRCRSSRRHRNR